MATRKKASPWSGLDVTAKTRPSRPFAPVESRPGQVKHDNRRERKELYRPTYIGAVPLLKRALTSVQLGELERILGKKPDVMLVQRLSNEIASACVVHAAQRAAMPFDVSKRLEFLGVSARTFVKALAGLRIEERQVLRPGIEKHVNEAFKAGEAIERGLVAELTLNQTKVAKEHAAELRREIRGSNRKQAASLKQKKWFDYAPLHAVFLFTLKRSAGSLAAIVEHLSPALVEMKKGRLSEYWKRSLAKGVLLVWKEHYGSLPTAKDKKFAKLLSWTMRIVIEEMSDTVRNKPRVTKDVEKLVRKALKQLHSDPEVLCPLR